MCGIIGIPKVHWGTEKEISLLQDDFIFLYEFL
jgi:hypothetical protein